MSEYVFCVLRVVNKAAAVKALWHLFGRFAENN